MNFILSIIKKLVALISISGIIIAGVWSVGLYLGWPLTTYKQGQSTSKANIDESLQIQMKSLKAENQELNQQLLEKTTEMQDIKQELAVFVNNKNEIEQERKEWLELFVLKQQLRFTSWQQIQKSILTTVIKKGLLNDLKDELENFNFAEEFLIEQEIEVLTKLGVNIDAQDGVAYYPEESSSK